MKKAVGTLIFVVIIVVASFYFLGATVVVDRTVSGAGLGAVVLYFDVKGVRDTLHIKINGSYVLGLNITVVNLNDNKTVLTVQKIDLTESTLLIDEIVKGLSTGKYAIMIAFTGSFALTVKVIAYQSFFQFTDLLKS